MTSDRNYASSTRAAPRRGRRAFYHWFTVFAFLFPAALVLGALLAYPIIFTFVRSTFDATGDTFIGIDNYVRIFSQPRTLIAVRNNLIWVLIVPAIITALGLVLAVLAQKVPWAAAFRMALFVPLVVSGLAAGVTFRFLYAADPSLGLVNAVIQTAVHLVQPPGPYPGARPSQPEHVAREAPDSHLVLNDRVAPGDSVRFGLVGIPPFDLPDEAERARAAEPPGENAISGTVWLDFSPAGEPGRVDEIERGLPGVDVEVVQDGAVVGTAVTGPDGTFVIEGVLGEHEVRLAARSFRVPWSGIPWLGPLLITPAIILGYIWIHTGFAVIITSAGLAGIDENLQAAARVEGANEWQVFRFVTAPLLRPVLMVVLVTTIISVLKIFDLVLVIAPESVQYDANVLALEMWRASFGGARDFGLGSALAALLFLMIIPAMLFNLRRFRME